jgi:hypothetical protein
LLIPFARRIFETFMRAMSANTNAGESAVSQSSLTLLEDPEAQVSEAAPAPTFATPVAVFLLM